MTLTALNYGAFQKPEEKNTPKASQNPVEAALAAYKLWLPVAKGSSILPDASIGIPSWEHPTVQMLYDEAVAAVRPIVSNVTRESLDEVIAGIDDSAPTSWVWGASGLWASGLFVSALHNESPVEELAGTLNYYILGYRLPASKRITVHKGSHVTVLGPYAQGDVVSFQDDGTSAVSPDAEGGLHVSFGKVVTIGLRSRNSTLVNLGSCRSLGDQSTDSCIINLGELHDKLPEIGKGVLYLNLGKTDGIVPEVKGTYIALGSLFGIPYNFGVVRDSRENAFDFDKNIPEYASLARALSSKVKSSLRYAELQAAQPQQAIEIIRGVDFAQLKKEITEIVDKT